MLQNSVVELLGMVKPMPEFQLFQTVRSHYDTEDLQILNDVGVVIGVFYSPGMNMHGYDPGWICVVCWLSLPSSPHLAVPFIDECFETDLRAI